MQRLGHLERGQVARDRDLVADAFEQAAIAEHPHRLDGKERDAIRGVAQANPNVRGQAGHEPGEQLVHGAVTERLERQRG